MKFGCLHCRNTTVDLTHIDTPANMNYWPLFHNGVAAGLKISNTSQVVFSIFLNFSLTNHFSAYHGDMLLPNETRSSADAEGMHDMFCQR